MDKKYIPHDMAGTFEWIEEECLELVHAVKKAKRFGILNHHPDRPQSNNFDDIRREFEDVMRSVEQLERLVNHEFFNWHEIEKGVSS